MKAKSVVTNCLAEYRMADRNWALVRIVLIVFFTILSHGCSSLNSVQRQLRALSESNGMSIGTVDQGEFRFATAGAGTWGRKKVFSPVFMVSAEPSANGRHIVGLYDKVRTAELRENRQRSAIDYADNSWGLVVVDTRGNEIWRMEHPPASGDVAVSRD